MSISEFNGGNNVKRDIRKIVGQLDAQRGKNELERKDGRYTDGMIQNDVWSAYAAKYGIKEKAPGDYMSASDAFKIIEKHLEEGNQAGNPSEIQEMFDSDPEYVLRADSYAFEELKPKEIKTAPRPQAPKPPEDNSVKHKAVDFSNYSHDEDPNFGWQRDENNNTFLIGDKNNDKKYSYDEAKAQIVRTNNLDTLEYFAKKLKINIPDFGGVNNDQKIAYLKKTITQSIDLLKKADKNGDMFVSDNELKAFDEAETKSQSYVYDAEERVNTKARMRKILDIDT